MPVIRAPLKIDSWHDVTVAARRLYHRAIVPILCLGLFCLVAANFFPGLHALVLSRL